MKKIMLLLLTMILSFSFVLGDTAGALQTSNASLKEYISISKIMSNTYLSLGIKICIL